MWHNIKNKPTQEGLYVVAQFEGDKMVDFHPEYALIEGYWGPNNIGWSQRIEVTHWMTRKEYREHLENAPREI